MWFFFGSELDFANDSNSFDLDIFLYDNEKIIHIATAGMDLINSLQGLDFSIYSNFKRVLSYRRVYFYETNASIQRDNLESIEDYVSFFELMAKRGFYSYDKVNIDNKEDFTFQLISKPIYNKKIILNKTVELGNFNSQLVSFYNLDIRKTKNNFPDNFEYFDIREYI